MKFLFSGKKIIAAFLAAAMLAGLGAAFIGASAPTDPAEIAFVKAEAVKTTADVSSANMVISTKAVSAIPVSGTDDAFAPDGTAYYMQIGSSRAGIAKENLGISTPNNKATVEAWVWIEDVSKVGTFVIRLFTNNLVNTNGSLIEGAAFQWNSAQDSDYLTPGKKLHTGWNLIRFNATTLGTNVNSISIHEHTANGTKNYNFAVSSFVVTPDGGAAVNVIDPVAAKQAQDVRSISVTYDIKNNTNLTGGDAGVPVGTSYYATLQTGKSGIVVSDLNLDVSKVDDKDRTGGSRYRMEAWVWVEDVSKVGNLVFRFYGENLSPYDAGNRSIIERWSWQYGGFKASLQNGWNKIVKNVTDMDVSVNYKNPAIINAVGLHEHTADITTAPKSYSIAVASIKFVRIPSDVATLSDISLSAGELDPAFSSANENYDVGVVNSVESIAITPTATDAGATVTVAGNTVASGTPSAPIALSLGENAAIPIVVTAENGAVTKTYLVTVTRALPASDNAKLSDLSLSEGTLSPDFSAGNLEYTATVSKETTSVTVTAAAEDAANAVILVDGAANAPVSLKYGENTITVRVTAEDGVTFKNYIIKVTREEPPFTGPGTDGNFTAFEADTEKAAGDLVQTAPTVPSSVSVVQNSTLAGGAAGAPTTGTAYQMLLNKGSARSGGAIPNLYWDVSTVKDATRSGTGYALDIWFYVSDVTKVNNIVVRLFQKNLRNDGAGSWIEFWPYQFGNLKTSDIDDETPGIQSLQTGWNHMYKYIENLGHDSAGRYKDPATIQAIALEDHGGALESYTLAVAHIALTKRAEEPVDDREWPLTELDDKCDTLTPGRYFYEIFTTALVTNAATLGQGHDGTANSAIYFNDVPLRNGWIARYGASAGTLLFSGTEASELTFWVYVSDISAISNTIFELGSSNIPDELEKEWNFKSQLKTNGWNQIKLDFSSGTGTLKLNEIRRFRIALLSDKTEGNIDIAFDNLKMTETDEAIIEPAVPQDNTGYEQRDSELNYDFDEIDETKYKYSSSAVVDTEEKKQGEASIKWVIPNTSSGTLLSTIMTKDDVFDFKIDDMNERYIGFWMYVSHADKLTQVALELATNGMDTDEWQWNVQGQIKADGWNYIVVPLNKDMVKQGDFDPEHIRFWRIFVIGGGDGVDMTIRLDDLSVVEKVFGDNTDPEKQFDYNCDTINTDKYIYQPQAELDTDAKEGTHSIRFTSPNTGTGTVMRIYSKPDKLNFSLEDWRTTYVAFWVYVNDPSLITRAAFELSSIGVDAEDEFEYNFTSQLVSEGWNQVMVPLLAYESKELVLEHITFTRIYMLGDGSGNEVIVKLDDLRLGTQTDDDDDIDWGDDDWDSDDPNENNPVPPTGDTSKALGFACFGLSVAMLLTGRYLAKKKYKAAKRRP